MRAKEDVAHAICAGILISDFYNARPYAKGWRQAYPGLKGDGVEAADQATGHFNVAILFRGIAGQEGGAAGQSRSAHNLAILRPDGITTVVREAVPVEQHGLFGKDRNGFAIRFPAESG